MGGPLVGRLLHLFTLLPDGVLVWAMPPKQHLDLAGREAGNPIPNSNGKVYWMVQVDRRKYRRSHLVFAMTHGHWPVEQVDHIDGNSLNDAPSNLREATATQNAWNHKRRAKRADTPMGVRKTRYGRFVARIGVNKKQIQIGTYGTAEEARTAYLCAREQYFGEFA